MGIKYTFLFVLLLSLIWPVTGQTVYGNQQTEHYFPLLKGKKVGLLVNHTSQIEGKHLLDTLLSAGIKVTTIFAPEHGFRGDADAGELVSTGIDARSGLPVVSLYGKTKKPSPQQLKGLDWVVFDLQDVGVRFFTYISSLHYLMEACAENSVGVMVLDRPNPNGDYVDGPLLEPKFKSFVGMHPIPVVHGLTVGELAQMINGEGWLKEGVTCRLMVVRLKNYQRNKPQPIAIKPSPNLPNDLSIRLYPSLCFFEGTAISVGRGTYSPFQVAGYPEKRFGDFRFVPQSIDGMANQPLHEGKACYGIDLREQPLSHCFTLKYLFYFFQKWDYASSFFSNASFFDLLAGTDKLRIQIQSGMSEDQIRLTWQPALNSYNVTRNKYLLYP
jgi:uncharacterized protein YbbC (DUF1343 family)